MSKVVRDGSFSRAQVKPKAVRRVLEASLDTYAGEIRPQWPSPWTTRAEPLRGFVRLATRRWGAR